MAVSDNKKSARRTQRTATSASDWKKSAAQLPLIETPTGKWIRMKKPGMTKFLEGGFLPDSLANAIRKEIASAKFKGGKKTNDVQVMNDLMKDVDQDGILDMMASMDRIVCAIVVEPKFVWHRRPVRENPVDPNSPVKLDEKGREITEEIPEEDRRGDVVYTDEMDQIDKNFVFQAAVGGSTDLARFRAQSTAVMDALSAGASLEEAAQRAATPQP